MDLLDEMAERVYTEMLEPEDQLGWSNEGSSIKDQFRSYAKAAAGALVDCEDVAAAISALRRFGAG